MKFIRSLASAAVLTFASLTCAHAANGVDIYACYACQNTGNSAIDSALAANPSVAYDGLLFAFVNTSGSDVTNAVFSVSNASPNDSFLIGTIAAGATAIVMPGVSNDNAVHPSGGLFENTGNTMDTSDGDGGVTDSSQFVFTGQSGSAPLSSGTITPGDAPLIQTYRDPGATGQTSFIGLGPDGDTPCTNCYFYQIGSATAPVAPVPEPRNFALLGVGLVAVYAARRRSPSRYSR